MERWMAIAGYEGRYEVSDLGRVKSLERWAGGAAPRLLPECILRQSPVTGGYLAISLCFDGESRTGKVHQLVLEAFVGPCPGDMEACHNNGDRTDNRLQNLRWDTKVGNMADKVTHGTDQRGENHGNASITDDQAAAIIADLAAGYTTAQAAERNGATPKVVTHIRNGAWPHLPRPTTMQVRHGKCALLPDDERAVVARLATGERASDLAREFGVSDHTIARARKRAERARVAA